MAKINTSPFIGKNLQTRTPKPTKKATICNNKVSPQPTLPITNQTTINHEASVKNKSYSTQRSFIFTKPKDKSIEIDNAVTETTELVTDENIELDRRTKQAAILTGNRLNLFEKKHLPWRTNALTKHEKLIVTEYLLQQLNNQTNIKMAIYAFCTLLTSKPFSELSNFIVTKKRGQAPEKCTNIIELETGLWWRKSIDMPEAFKPTPSQKKQLQIHSEWLALPIPLPVREALLNITKSTSTLGLLCGIEESPSTQLSQFLKPCWKNNSQVHRRITPAALRASMFDSLAHQFDSGYACLLLANTEYDTPTTLYYLYDTTPSLQRAYCDALQANGLPIQFHPVDDQTVIGSQLAINMENFSNLIRAKQLALCEFSGKTVEEMIVHHNALASYITLMLMAATAHRKRSEYGFSPFSIQEALGYILLADKVNYADSAMRILPLCDMVIEQLQSYRHHCANLARKLSSKFHNVAIALAKVNSSDIYDSPFLFHIQNNGIKTIGNHQIETYLHPDLSLPSNFLRHYFCSYLRQQKQYKFNKAVMGHVSNGEHILADFSCCHLSELDEIKPLIENSLTQLGFKAIVKAKPRGKLLPITGKKSLEHYAPNYLKRSEEKEIKNQIKWAKNLIQPFTKRLKKEKGLDLKATTTIIYDKVLADSNASISLERKFYWVNRFLNKVSKNNRWVLEMVTPQRHRNVPRLKKLSSKINQTNGVTKMKCSVISIDLVEITGSDLAFCLFIFSSYSCVIRKKTGHSNLLLIYINQKVWVSPITRLRDTYSCLLGMFRLNPIFSVFTRS